jgi:hypothetical protein
VLYLDYRGKRVLYRAHVPILNVNDFACFLNKFAAGCP